jgi:hypothetical protein
MCVTESQGGIILTGNTEKLGEKPMPGPLGPPQLPYVLARSWQRAYKKLFARLSCDGLPVLLVLSAHPFRHDPHEDGSLLGYIAVFCPWSRPTFRGVYCLMEALRISETSVYSNQTTLHYIPESSQLHTRFRENLKSHISYSWVWQVC